MQRSLPKPLLIAGLVTIGALVPWFLSTRPSQPAGERARVVWVDEPPVAAPAVVARKPKPAAMENPGTYAAVRLKEVKANPAAWNDVWKWREEFAAANNPALQSEVLALARQVGPDSLLAVLAQALASDDPTVRLDAARSIAMLPEERLRDGFALGVEAADPEIREEVMDLVLQLQPHLRADLLRVALAAASVDVQTRAVGILSDQPNPEFFGALIDGLRTVSSDVRPLLNQATDDIVGHVFSGFDEGSVWWAQNRVNYDDLMSQIP